MGIEENKALVREYFLRMQAGDPTVAEMMAEDITWWVPQSSELGGTHRGKAAVLALTKLADWMRNQAGNPHDAGTARP